MACPGSVVLPQFQHVGTSAGGSALHQYLDVKVRRGAAAAEREIVDIAERWELDDGEREEFERTARRFEPSIPEGAISEVPLVMLADRTVQLVVGARGEYDAPPDAIIAGTIDLLWSEPDPLIVERDGDGRVVSACCPRGSVVVALDWKSGEDQWVAPSRVNWQVRAGALLAARWTRAASAVAGICFIRPGPGLWDMAPAMGTDAIARVETALVEQAQREQDEAARATEGKPPRLTTGAHCDWCPSRPLCPAHVAEARALATLDSPSTLAASLTDEQAAHLAGILSTVRRTIEKVDDALRARVQATGQKIRLPDGRVWGPEATTRDAIDPRVAIDVLTDEIGGEAALSACSMSASSIERAIKKAHEEAGLSRKVAPTKRRVLDAARAAGGIVAVPSERWGIHWEKD